MAYSEFLDLVKTEQKPGEYVMKDGSRFSGLKEQLSKAITLPEFYSEWSELQGLELVQGSFFMDKPHYDSHEQFVCAVKGNMNIVVIPHVNRK